METTTQKQTPPTQELLEVFAVENDALILKNGGLRKVLIVSGLNFELKSEEEQNVALAEYQSFLNTLDFPLQIFIHSRKINIDEYRDGLRAYKQTEHNKLLASLLGEYDAFIESLVNNNAIMQKRFFAVVPHDPFVVSLAGKTIAEKIKKIFAKGPVASSVIPEAEYIALNQRVDRVISGLSNIGLRALPLMKDELIELLDNLYNPETIERRDVKHAT